MKYFPKIIHSIAPKDKSNWHDDWHLCYPSWENHFKNNFEFKLWNDEEDLDSFVSENYPEFNTFFQDLPLKIMKIDIARLLILHKYGGIFHDMDYICYENFYDEVNANAIEHGIETFFVENRSGTIGEYMQNSLVITNPNNNLFIEAVMLSNTIWNFYKQIYTIDQLKKDRDPLVVFITGPIVVQLAVGLNKQGYKSRGILNHMNFNPPSHTKPSNFKAVARHLSTGVWFKDE